ncbi:MAG TPA: hypothetical protein PKE07_00210 [Lacibacter sp.]|nr:hypothetical protein [Lacibacter sp.]HMO88280.1 hypothetical protein [Lacibacter sp.]
MIRTVVLLLLLLLLAGSLVWFRERMLFADPGFMTFTLLNKGRFAIQEYRYGAWITQLIPLLGGWLRAPLPVILAAYSAGFYLFYTVTALLLFRFRQPELALLLVLYLTLQVTDGWFWPNNEVHQGIAWMLLALGWLRSGTAERSAVLRYGLFFLLSFFALFSHFLVALPFFFLWSWWRVAGSLPPLSGRTRTLLTAGLLALFAVKYYLGTRGWYDGPKLEGIRRLRPEQILELFHTGHWRSMAPLFITRYATTLLLLAGGALALVRKRQWVLLAGTILTLLLYILLTGLTFPDAFGRDLLFYMESQWMAAGLIAAVPFVYAVLPRLRTVTATWVLGLVFLVRLGWIAASQPLFAERYKAVAQICHTLHSKGIHNGLLVKDRPVAGAFLADWGTPVESLLYSALQGWEPQVSFQLVEPGAGTDSGRFQSCFESMPYGALNRRYFRPDSLQPYRVLPLSEVWVP